MSEKERVDEEAEWGSTKVDVWECGGGGSQTSSVEERAFSLVSSCAGPRRLGRTTKKETTESVREINGEERLFTVWRRRQRHSTSVRNFLVFSFRFKKKKRAPKQKNFSQGLRKFFFSHHTKCVILTARKIAHFRVFLKPFQVSSRQLKINGLSVA